VGAARDFSFYTFSNPPCLWLSRLSGLLNVLFCIQNHTPCISLYTAFLMTIRLKMRLHAFYAFSRYWHKNGIYFCTKLKHQTMKSLTKTTVILKALDLELKALLKADIENFKSGRSYQKQLQTQQAAWSIYKLSSTYEKSRVPQGLFFLVRD